MQLPSGFSAAKTPCRRRLRARDTGDIFGGNERERDGRILGERGDFERRSEHAEFDLPVMGTVTGAAGVGISVMEGNVTITSGQGTPVFFPDGRAGRHIADVDLHG